MDLLLPRGSHGVVSDGLHRCDYSVPLLAKSDESASMAQHPPGLAASGAVHEVEVSSLSMMGTESLLAILFNRNLSIIGGEMAVGARTVITRVNAVICHARYAAVSNNFDLCGLRSNRCYNRMIAMYHHQPRGN